MSKPTPKPKSLPPYVTLSKTGVYRYRRRVPDHLRETIGKLEIKESLGKDYSAALKRHAVIQASVEKMFAQKPRKNSNVRTKIMSKLRDHGVDLQALAAVASDEEGSDGLMYLILDALEELDEEGDVPRDLLKEVAKGQLPVTLESALDDYRDHKATGDAVADKLLTQQIDRHKERLKRYLGADAVTRRALTRLKRVDARKVVEGFLTEVSAASTTRNINDIRAAVNRAIREHDLDMANPFDKLEIKSKSRPKDAREPLDDDDMRRLADVMETDDDLGLIWETLRDTGARLREVAGLRVCDVDLTRKTIAIVPHTKRSLKTANSEREVPIPDALVQRYAETISRMCKDQGAGRDAQLFPRYVGGRNPDSCSKTLMKRLRKVVKDERKKVHSLRHRMKDLLRNTDCPEVISKEILGHSDQSIAANYGAGHALDVKRKALEKAWEAGKVSG